MEVVCLILGPMLASQPCLHAFWVLTSLHIIENVFYYSCIANELRNITDTRAQRWIKWSIQNTLYTAQCGMSPQVVILILNLTHLPHL